MMKILVFVFIRWVVHGISHVVGQRVSLVDGLGVSLVDDLEVPLWVWAWDRSTSVIGLINCLGGSQISKRTLCVKSLKWNHQHH